MEFNRFNCFYIKTNEEFSVTTLRPSHNPRNSNHSLLPKVTALIRAVSWANWCCLQNTRSHTGKKVSIILVVFEPLLSTQWRKIAASLPRSDWSRRWFSKENGRLCNARFNTLSPPLLPNCHDYLKTHFQQRFSCPRVRIKNRLWMMPALADSGLGFMAQVAQKQGKATCNISR